KVHVGIPKLTAVMGFVMIAFCVYDLWETQKQVDMAQTWEQREEALVNQRISIFRNILYACPVLGDLLITLDVMKITLLAGSDIFRLATKFNIPGLEMVRYVGTDSIMKFIADQTVPLYPPGTRFWMLTQDLY